MIKLNGSSVLLLFGYPRLEYFQSWNDAKEIHARLRVRGIDSEHRLADDFKIDGTRSFKFVSLFVSLRC